MKLGRQVACLLLLVLLGEMQAQVRSGSSTESDANLRVESILAKMTLEEKIDFLSGTDGFF
ncbi:MAG: hypothetical protein ABR953_03735, partial [Candidatus Acidiferrales bacterium]